jgi:molybdenum cofactor cytidylyltransferase
MGTPKQLLDLEGRTLIERILEAALDSRLNPVLCITGKAHDAIVEKTRHLPVEVLPNEAWQEGMSSSIRCGVSHLEKSFNLDGLMLMVADQPFITAELLTRLMRRFEDEQAQAFGKADVVVLPSLGDRRGNPALFSPACFGHLKALKGDEGARQLFGEFRLCEVPVRDEHIFFDIDTLEDLEFARTVFSRRKKEASCGEKGPRDSAR